MAPRASSPFFFLYHGGVLIPPLRQCLLLLALVSVSLSRSPTSISFQMLLKDMGLKAKQGPESLLLLPYSSLTRDAHDSYNGSDVHRITSSPKSFLLPNRPSLLSPRGHLHFPKKTSSSNHIASNNPQNVSSSLVPSSSRVDGPDTIASHANYLRDLSRARQNSEAETRSSSKRGRDDFPPAQKTRSKRSITNVSARSYFAQPTTSGSFFSKSFVTSAAAILASFSPTDLPRQDKRRFSATPYSSLFFYIRGDYRNNTVNWKIREWTEQSGVSETFSSSRSQNAHRRRRSAVKDDYATEILDEEAYLSQREKHWTVARNVSESRERTLRGGSAIGVAPIFSCLGQSDGFYADPTYCTQYYICTFGRKSLQNCPVGTVYNPDSYVCDFPEKVVCGRRYLPPSYLKLTSSSPSTHTFQASSGTTSAINAISTYGATTKHSSTVVVVATGGENAIFTTPSHITKHPTRDSSVLECDFDHRGQCEYMQDVYDDFDWIRNCGPTPSETTGPENDHTRGQYLQDVPNAACSGHYMFVEASLPRRQGDLARFISPISNKPYKLCLQFWYHMRGLAVGALRVYTKPLNQKTLSAPIWSRSSSQSPKWIFGQVTLKPGPLQVIFEAEIGKGWSGDIAIDDVRTVSGSCGSTNCAELLYPSQFCDRILDCEDRSDELNCGWCPRDFFLCPEFSCVRPERICNGKNDCLDGSDEKNCIQLVPAEEATGMQRLKTAREHDGFLTINIAGRWRRVCFDNWPLLLSDEICHFLGYEATNYSKMYEWRSTDVLRLDTEYLLKVAGGLANAVRLFRQSHNCTSGNVLYLNCGEEQCGRRPAYSPVPSRIIGGSQSAPGVWPWHVQILVDGKYQCGGSLVGQQWIVTASHCVEAGGDGQFTAIAGSVHRIDFSVHQQERIVDMKLKHPNYKHYESGYDIALLRVRHKFKFDDYARSICLPMPDEKLLFGERCVAIGWGTTDANEGPPVETLRHVFLPVVSNDLCNSLPWLRGRISETMVCAGSLEGGKDTCGGDSGGSLACQRKDGRWFLAGITSWGYGCGAQNNLGVYARVPSLVKWARNAMRQHKLPHEMDPGYGLTEPPTTNNNFYHRNLYSHYHRL